MTGDPRARMFNRLDCPADSHKTNATETHPWLTRGPQGQPFQCKVRRSEETSSPEAGSAKEPGDLCIDRNAWNEWATSGPVRPCAGQTLPGPSGLDKVCQHPGSTRSIWGAPAGSHPTGRRQRHTWPGKHSERRRPHREAQRGSQHRDDGGRTGPTRNELAVRRVSR